MGVVVFFVLHCNFFDNSFCTIAEDDLPSVLKFYHELGVILYYPHIRSLSDKVILSPSWFVDCLGKVLTLPGATSEERHEYKVEWNLLRSKLRNPCKN